jgi:hypothetical protein
MPAIAPLEMAYFEGTMHSAELFPAQYQVVTQRAGEATVMLSRSSIAGILQVRVTTDPLSPVVGVNVGAVDQTVTFANGQSEAAVTVPILPGAPNPGAVDVDLIIDPVGPPPTVGSTNMLDLRILASDPALPPKVVSTLLTDQGIVLSFNKPMDPVSASNAKNYTVTSANSHTSRGILSFGGLLPGLFGRTSTAVNAMHPKSAQYDPATQSVTLIPKHKGAYDVNAWGTLKLVNPAKTPARPGHRSGATGSLTDLQGNLINASTSPGSVALLIKNPSFGGVL